jgi:hypothetical protein
MTKVFFLEPTDRERLWLRRYRNVADGATPCEKSGNCCNAMFQLGEGDIRYTADGYIDASNRKQPPNTDSRWPSRCDACGWQFESTDAYQLFSRQIYVRLDTGFCCTLEDALPGACWDAWWISERRKDGPTGCGYMVGPDYRALVVKCPDGHAWHIDARARDCTMPDDNAHHCWVRHGSPEDGTLHVDKNGLTCGAGGGSIDTGRYHGFLHNGHLHESS